MKTFQWTDELVKKLAHAATGNIRDFVSNNDAFIEDFKQSKIQEAKLMEEPLLSLNDLLHAWNGGENIELYKTAPLFLNFKEKAVEKLEHKA